MLFASVVALAAGESAASWFVVATAVVQAALGFGSALLAQTRHDCVLDVIIDGRGRLPLAAVQRQRRRLLDRAHRAFLARWLDGLRHDAQRPIPRFRAARPVYSVLVIAAVAPDLQQIARLLHTDHAGLRGIALTERALRDGTSPQDLLCWLAAGQWHIAEATYRIALGKAPDDLVLTAEARLTEQPFGS